MQCGYVGCCDSSPNKHATAHFHDARHGVVRSFRFGEQRAFCYVDDDMVPGVGDEVERSYA